MFEITMNNNDDMEIFSLVSGKTLYLKKYLIKKDHLAFW